MYRPFLISHRFLLFLSVSSESKYKLIWILKFSRDYELEKNQNY